MSTRQADTLTPPFFPHAPDAQVISTINVGQTPMGTIGKYMLHMVTDGMGNPTYVPVIVARGEHDGPVVGLTAAVHGNELNGIPVIQRLIASLDPKQLRGTVVGVPGINMPSLLRKKRRFIDGTDLNHIMPGREDGAVSQVYAYRIVERVVKHFNYLFDLHTASFGRVNSYYIRADMANEEVRAMALHQRAQIIVHNPPGDGTLRGAADDLGIPAITLEVGDPNKFQRGIVRSTATGIHNFLIDKGMIEGIIEPAADESIRCKRSFWIYTDTGGLLSVLPKITEFVKEGEVVAKLRNAFGDDIRSYRAPEDGVVIGHSISPVCQTGGRILHLGVV